MDMLKKAAMWLLRKVRKSRDIRDSGYRFVQFEITGGTSQLLKQQIQLKLPEFDGIGFTNLHAAMSSYLARIAAEKHLYLRLFVKGTLTRPELVWIEILSHKTEDSSFQSPGGRILPFEGTMLVFRQSTIGQRLLHFWNTFALYDDRTILGPAIEMYQRRPNQPKDIEYQLTLTLETAPTNAGSYYTTHRVVGLTITPL